MSGALKQPGPVLIKKTGERVQMATALEKIQKLQEQIEEAKVQALEELREKRREAQAALADIDRQIAELGGAARARVRASRKSGAGAVCPICEVAGHDGRAHRSQGRNKKPFTEEELRTKSFA
jgi:DNA repair exonuclease SbcCD ATPase subunit